MADTDGFHSVDLVILCRRRNEKSQKDDPAGNRLDAVQRHGGVLKRSVGVDSDVALLRSSTFTIFKAFVSDRAPRSSEIKKTLFQDPNAPLPVIYENLGMPVLKYLVTGGAVFALFTT